MRSQTAALLLGPVRPLFSAAAGMPRAPAADTWSCIREMSGETRCVSPPRRRAGTWKQTDLPAAGGKHGERVPARQDGSHHAGLGRPEIRVAEVSEQRRAGRAASGSSMPRSMRAPAGRDIIRPARDGAGRPEPGGSAAEPDADGDREEVRVSDLGEDIVEPGLGEERGRTGLDVEPGAAVDPEFGLESRATSGTSLPVALRLYTPPPPIR